MTGISATESRAPFMPQLDALRAFAVMAVLLHHLLNARFLPSALRLGWGFYGVHLFFVISGYLITGILIRARDAAGPGTGDKPFALRQFFIRRFLRIFPLYYLVVLGGLLLGIDEFRDNAVSLLTYTFNFKIAAQGWYPDIVAHFWSLAVEEQFYLVWPWVVLFVARKRLPLWAGAMVLIAPLFRLAVLLQGVSPLNYYHPTPACLDSLGAGALLAIASGGAPAPAALRRTLSRFVLLPALAGILLLDGRLGDFAERQPIHVVLYGVLWAMFCCWLVAGASAGFRGPFGRLLNARWLQYIGRIAYGVYVYHLLLAKLVFRGGTAAGLSWRYNDPLYFVVASTITILVAAISWRLFERPINDLKKRFEYHRAARG